MIEKQSKKVNLVLAAVFVSTFMTSVETTIITTVLPTIVNKLNGLSMQSWVFSIYLLTIAISTPIYGKLSDRKGRKFVYILGLTLFIAGSILCGLANNIMILILCRGIQGLGAGAIIPVTFIIIADLVLYKKRAKILAINNTAWGISALVGPLLGGFLVERLSWNWVFFINVPLGLLVFIVILLSYSEETVKKEKLPIDYKGIFSLSMFLITLLLLLQWMGESVSSWIYIIPLFLILIFLGAVFYKVEIQALDPLIPLSLFNNHLFKTQILTAMILSGIQIGFQTYFPIWLQSIYRISPSMAGLAVTPSPVFWLIASFFVGGLIKKYSSKSIIVFFIMIMSLAYLPLPFAGINFAKYWFYVIASITGICLGIIITINMLISQKVVPKSVLGTATSMITLGRTLGQTVAFGVFGFLFNISLSQKLKIDSHITLTQINNYIGSVRDKVDYEINEIVLQGFHYVFWSVMIMFLLVIVINLRNKNNKVV